MNTALALQDASKKLERVIEIGEKYEQVVSKSAAEATKKRRGQLLLLFCLSEPS